FGKGESEARRTEFHNVSLAVASMMIDNGISTIPNPEYAAVDDLATNFMGYIAGETPADNDGFPDSTTKPLDDLDPLIPEGIILVS
ncbi:unnamed protein product, partial [marine sediment metagenome]